MSTDNINGTLSSTGNLNGTFGTSGGGGTSNYNDLANKPQINGNTLEGNKTPAQLGINIPDMTNYYNKTETNTLLDGKADTSDLPDMSNYYDKSETDTLLDGKADTSDLPDMNNYYDKSETDDLLNGKVDNSDFNAASLPITSGSATNTKDYIDSGLGGKADSSTTYTKTEVDAKVPKYFDLTVSSSVSDSGISPFSYYGQSTKTDSNIHNILSVTVIDTQFNNPAIAVLYGVSGSTYTFMVYSARSGNVKIRVVYK